MPRSQDGKPFLPGETVSGKIEAVFKKSLKINSVTLSAWSHTAGHFSFKTRVRGEKGGKTRTPRFDFKEDFLKDEIIEHAVDFEEGKNFVGSSRIGYVVFFFLVSSCDTLVEYWYLDTFSVHNHFGKKL